MADELDPKNENEEMGRTNPEDVIGSADEEEEFEDIDEGDDDDDDLETEPDASGR
jgi:hypothetical protein